MCFFLNFTLLVAVVLAAKAVETEVLVVVEPPMRVAVVLAAKAVETRSAGRRSGGPRSRSSTSR